MQGGVTTQPDFEAVYARTFASIKAKCLRLVSNPQAADDIAQETFLRLWEWRARPAMDGPDGARTILAWLYRTSTRLAIDALRTRRRMAHDPVDLARARDSRTRTKPTS
jgi:RNA polymerase sigma-70 factor (ECF subfamily)